MRVIIITINRILNFGLVRYFSPFMVLLAISYLSFADFSNSDFTETSIPQLDKLVHLTMYFTLAYVFLVTKIFKINRYDLKVALFCVSFGIFTELMQYYVFKYRSGDYVDLLSDFVGILIGFILFSKTKYITN